MSDTPLPSSPAPDPSLQKLTGRVVVFQDQHEIYFDHGLPRLNTTGVRAYMAKSLRGIQELAYISERSAIPRLQFSEKYLGFQNTVQARLVARGIVRCPDGFERYCFLYENTLGNPLIPDLSIPAAYAMRAETVVTAILHPILMMLQELHNTDLAHGAIRVDNLFDGGQQPLQSVRLGDCLAQSYLAAQPAIYLPPPLSVAMPSGRGLETSHDDIYALGVTCALLVRSHDTTSNKTDEEILVSKLEFGTFSTLIESERLPSNILELLRGMLHDDPIVRWTVQDIADWFEGKRATRRSGSMRLKGSRHLNIGMHKILLPSLFSYYAPAMVDEAAKLIENDEVKQWIRRSISDVKLDQRYEAALESSRDYVGTPSYNDRLICRVSIAMDSSFPVAYQGLRFFPDSIGSVLAEILISGRDPKPIAELINDQTIIYWMNTQTDVPTDINLAINRSEQCQQFLKQRTAGYGIERCVYFLAPDIPCLSSNLRGYYVNSPEQLLHALNQVAMMNDRPERILDRHMTAFLSVRDRKIIDKHLPDLNASEHYRQVTGTFGILAAIQKNGRVGTLPGLSKWMHTLAEPLYGRFHDRDLRASIRKKMNDMKDQGLPSRMADILFDRETIRRDQYEYRAASHEYNLLGLEQRALQEALKYKERYGTQAGREIAALISGVVMALAVVGFILIRFGQGDMPW